MKAKILSTVALVTICACTTTSHVGDGATLQAGLRVGYSPGRGLTVGPAVAIGSAIAYGSLSAAILGGADVSFTGDKGPLLRLHMGTEAALSSPCPAIFFLPVTVGPVLSIDRSGRRLGWQLTGGILFSPSDHDPYYGTEIPFPLFLTGMFFRHAHLGDSERLNEIGLDSRWLFSPFFDAKFKNGGEACHGS